MLATSEIQPFVIDILCDTYGYCVECNIFYVDSFEVIQTLRRVSLGIVESL
jgi:hypothetical protein